MQQICHQTQGSIRAGQKRPPPSIMLKGQAPSTTQDTISNGSLLGLQGPFITKVKCQMLTPPRTRVTKTANQTDSMFLDHPSTSQANSGSLHGLRGQLDTKDHSTPFLTKDKGLMLTLPRARVTEVNHPTNLKKQMAIHKKPPHSMFQGLPSSTSKAANSGSLRGLRGKLGCQDPS